MDAYYEAIKDINPENIIYIDEMGIDTFIYVNMPIPRGGVKVIGRISGKKYKRTSIVAAKLGKNII